MKLYAGEVSNDTPAGRLRAALELAETGVEMKRQNLRRAYPTETAEEIDDRLRAWLGDWPLDAPGRVVRLSP